MDGRPKLTCSMGAASIPTGSGRSSSRLGHGCLRPRRGGALIGCCHIEARTEGEAYLGLLSVRPGLQRQGVGRAMVARAEREARARWGGEQMRMRVIRQREDLIAWYERLGYRRNGETIPFPYDAPGVIARRSDLEFVVLIKPTGPPSAPAR